MSRRPLADPAALTAATVGSGGRGRLRQLTARLAGGVREGRVLPRAATDDVNLDFTPTFTPALLLKDFKLGFSAADDLGAVPMPLAAAARDVVAEVVGDGEYDDVDFAALLEVLARRAGVELMPETVSVDDGLAPLAVAT
jgi:3-hydroxyisobutyrate dehydrogenase-like beta-hydroxyacid dehydrogenase